MKNIQIILNAILSKNIFEYILIDDKLNVLDSSDGIEKYIDNAPKKGDDILEYLPELVGSEDEIQTIFIKKYCLYSLESVHKNDYYINISVEYCDPNTAIILLHNITAITLSKQKLLQYSNESTLLYNTLQKVVDNQTAFLFVSNQYDEIEFANQKFINYFNIEDIKELKEKKLKIYNYCKNKIENYDEFYQYITAHEEYQINIENDTFIVQATAIEATHKLFTLTKVTEIYKRKETLEVEIKIDPLTKTYRKPYFDIQLEKALKHDKDIAVVVLDIDNFKHVNDKYGHFVGDIVLKEFTALIKENLRKDDLIARWGGEEFLILFKNIEKESIIIKVEELRRLIDEYTFTEVKHITSSFGLAYANIEDTSKSILKRADEALYKAKNNGKNCIYITQ
jgi:diguanylate cyclase (GGDEF)-like protein